MWKWNVLIFPNTGIIPPMILQHVCSVIWRSLWTSEPVRFFTMAAAWAIAWLCHTFDWVFIERQANRAGMDILLHMWFPDTWVSMGCIFGGGITSPREGAFSQAFARLSQMSFHIGFTDLHYFYFPWLPVDLGIFAYYSGPFVFPFLCWLQSFDCIFS